MPFTSARLMAVVLVSGLSLAHVPALRAQTPSADPQPEPAAPPPSPIRLDAVVTDPSGRRVLDLRASDFDVKVNGVELALEGLEVRTPPRPRVFAFFLDEYHVRADATMRVREAMLRFIDTELRPEDRVVLLRPLDPVTNLQFSMDPATLRAKVAAFEGRKDDLTARTPFEEQFIGRAPQAVEAARAQIVTLALTEIAVQLGELGADRAALVLVSEGFRRGTQELSRRQGRLPDLQGVVRAASRYHFAIYTLNPSGIEADDPGPAMLDWLAGQTGGVSVAGGDTFEKGLTQVAADTEAFYALQLPAPENNGRFHRVEVSAKRAGLAVRTQPGYWAPLSSEIRALLDRSTPPPLRAARALRRSPLIDAWVGLRPAERGRLAMVFSWVPSQRDPRVKQPVIPAVLEVRARTEQGRVLYEGRVASLNGGIAAPNVATFEAPPGRVEFDIRVLDARDEQLDTDVRDVQVPAFAKDARIALLPIEILRARTVPEYRRLAEDPNAVPTPVRTFTRTERLIVRTPVWQVDTRSAIVTAHVVNRRGQILRALDNITAPGGVTAFDLPLAWLAPGEYYIEVRARVGDDGASERIPFRLTH